MKMKFFKTKRRTPNDKIFDNSYNKGEIEYEQFRPIEIDKGYSVSRMGEYNNSFDYFQNEKLSKRIENIYRKTTWRRVYKNRKRIPKSELPEMYTFFHEAIKNELFNNCEFFVSFADFLDVGYKVLYELIPYKYRADILRELDDKFNILETQKMPRLF